MKQSNLQATLRAIQLEARDYYITLDDTLCQCVQALDDTDARRSAYKFGTRRVVKHIRGFELHYDNLSCVGKWRDAGWEFTFNRRGNFNHVKDFYRKATFTDKLRHPVAWLVLWLNT